MADLNIGNSSASVVVNAKHNGSVIPQINNTYNLGTSDLRWKNIYGDLKGNADTATTATNLASAGTWTWTNGTTAGPTASLVLGGKTTSVGAIPSASSSASGIITTGTQTIAGEKTFTSNLFIKRNTPNLYITDTNTGADTCSIIRFGSTNASGTTNENAASIFLNGSQRTNDGGASLMTIRNNVGDLRLNNDVINTGKLTIGQATKNDSYKLYVNGTQYIQSNSNSSTTKGLTINNGILSISNYNQTLSVGAQNTSWTHFETTGSQFYFNKQIHIDGNLTKHNYSNAGYGTISGYNLAGNAATATKLATARTISLTGSVTGSGTFDGSGNLSISTTTNHSHSYLSYKPILNSESAINSFHAANTFQAAIWNETSFPGVGNGIILDMGYVSDTYGAQIAIDDDTTYFMALRQRGSDGWNAWKRIPMSDGTGASGTWDISISGSSKNISYPAQLTTNDAIDAFNIGNVFQVSTWNNTSSPGVSNGIIINAGWTNATYGAQIAIDDDPTYFMALRQRGGDGWNAWKRIPMGDGTGASGTWDISINGNAAISTISRSLGSDDTMKVYGQYNNEVNFGGTNNSSTIYFGYRAVDSKPIPSKFIFGGGGGTAELVAAKVYGAVWNDYAEYRETHHEIEPGRCVIEVGDGSLTLAFGRLQPGANIVSDTFGFAIGETETNKTPLAVSGRVLAYPNEPRESYHPGDPICSGPNGTISRMTREEVREWPDRIVGTVSEIPNYETWGTGNVEVNGRIWIKVK